TWGAIATGLFATKTVNSAGADGLFYGDASLLLKQLIAIGSTYVFAGVVTFLIIKVIGFFVNVRVDQEEENLGLDLAIHGEKA
ncbi:ammonia channel protein, partial [Pseudomonas sp. FW305-BF6]